MKSRSAARAGLIRREAGGDDDREGGLTSTQRWSRRLGLEEQRLYEMVRLRGQFLELLQQAGLHNDSNVKPAAGGGRDQSDKLGGSSHRRALQQAQHREHLKTKRRRVLTLQDNASCPFKTFVCNAFL